jgi:hypothetical protein
MRALLVVAFLMLGAASGFTEAQVRSDYQVQQEFEAEYRSILEAIRVARTVVECVEIDSRLIDLELNYREYAPMLEKALYPDGYDGGLTKARGQLDATKEKLNVIEDQYVQILQLETRVRTLATEVDSLSLLNSTLLGELQSLRGQSVKDKRAIDSLSAIVIRLRAGMRDRDRMIFAMVDSLFLQYDKDVSAMTDAERQGIAARIERRNIFSSIRQSVDDNVRFLENTSLSGSDFREISREQRDFQSKWAGLGPKLGELYIDSKSRRAEEIAAIDTMLMVWDSKLDTALWRALNQTFAERDIELPPFTSTEQFLLSLHGYLDAEIRSASETRDGSKYLRYEAFADSLWAGEIVPHWLPVMRERSLLSDDQISDIESKIDDWRSQVSPPSMLTYFIVGFFLVVVLGVLYALFRKKKPKLPPPQAPPSTN